MTKLETKIRDLFRYNSVLRKYRKEDPLKYTYILKERGYDYGSDFVFFAIDDGMFITSTITDGGIQSCGLYFKVGRYGQVDGYYSTEAKMLDLCRISMERPEYITGFNETFKLNDKQKESLIKMLNKKIGDGNITLWEYMFDTMNSGREYTKKFPKLKVLPMPDYSLLN